MASIIKQVSEREKIVEIAFNSEQYQDEISLRYEILRKPLHLDFSKEQLAAESDWIHLGYYKDGILIGCLVLIPEDEGKIKMKQVAIASAWQGRGIGKELVLEAEKYAVQKDFTFIYCHARDTAVPFYEKLGYRKAGDVFIEVSIPHFEMEKQLV